MTRNYILLTNDDGFDAPGLLALAQALRQIAEVEIVAPDRNRSAVGHAKTMHKPLRVKPAVLRDGTAARACDGAPSDCVALVLLGLIPERPALVVSGINPGANVAHDLTYSGTVAAAMEAAIFGVPAIAVSLDANSRGARLLADPDFGFAGQVARRLAAKVLQEGLLEDSFLNVNVPDLPAAEIRGIRITRTGRRIYRDELIERRDPRGFPYYWIGGDPPTGDLEQEGTDVWAVANGYVSITPVHMDMTNHALADQMEHWADDLEERGS